MNTLITISRKEMSEASNTELLNHVAKVLLALQENNLSTPHFNKVRNIMEEVQSLEWAMLQQQKDS